MNKPITRHAIVLNGSILLPLRETFESLNATVSYDDKTKAIVARNILHVVLLHVNDRVAWVDRRPHRLDTPPQIVHEVAYVPLRFTAEALGALVRYDARTKTVAVNGSDGPKQATVIGHLPDNASPAPNAPVLVAYPAGSASLPATVPYGYTLQIFGHYPQPYGAGGWGGLTIIGPPAGNGFAQMCGSIAVYPISSVRERWNPGVAQHFVYGTGTCSSGVFYGVGWRGRILVAPINNGLYLTGDPLHPIGQFPGTPSIVPLFPR